MPDDGGLSNGPQFSVEFISNRQEIADDNDADYYPEDIHNS